jgi:hypothetical protein
MELKGDGLGSCVEREREREMTAALQCVVYISQVRNSSVG